MTQAVRRDVISSIRFYIDKIVSDTSIEGKLLLLLLLLSLFHDSIIAFIIQLMIYTML